MNLSKYIDHTLLKAEARKDQIETLCREADEHNFMSVCVNPTWVAFASELLQDSDVKVCTVVGFPLGATTTEVKAFEAKNAVENGAEEVDMVINIGWVKSGKFDKVQNEIEAVVDSLPENIVVKVIIETCLLTPEEITEVSMLVKKAGADFVKTSTGFSTGGATIEDVILIREAVGPDMNIKASGGISNKAQTIALIEAGATRIGASKGVQIMAEK